MAPDVPRFYRNQSRRCENHEKFRPALLHVNADSFGKENATIEERQKSSRPQSTAGQHLRQFVQQKGNRLPVLEKKLITVQIANGVNPCHMIVEKEQRAA